MTAPVPLWRYVEQLGLASLVYGVSKDPNAKVTVVLFSPKSGRAVYALKAPTSDAAAVAVEHEARVLRRLPELGLGDLADTIPRVIDVVDYNGRSAAVMSAVPGVPMSTSYMRGRHTARRGRVAADFAAVAAWLDRLQAAGASGQTIALDMDAGVQTRLRRRFPDEPLDDALGRLAEVHARLRQEAVPETVVHGDLWMGNVLMSERRVSGVVDWEEAAMRGQPVRDLARFAYIYALYLDRRTRVGRKVPGHAGLRAGDWGAGVRYSLESSGWFPDLFREFVQNGLARLGAAPSCWRDVVLAAIAEVAALTDDGEFARRNLHLFADLAGHERSGRPERRRASHANAPNAEYAGFSVGS